MKRYLGSLATVLFFGASILGMGATARAQQAPPASQQPMEIPAQYPQYPPPQGGPQPGGPRQAGPPQQASTEPGAARVSFIQGDVSTQLGGAGEWVAATLNTPVVARDQVSTGQRSRAEIELDHANILRMSDESTANVANLSRTQILLQVGAGLVNYDVLKGNEADVEIDTPNVAIHPQLGEGSYRILVNSDGETIVDVRRGSAEISTSQGSTHVEKDQRITIQGSADSAQYQVSNAPGRDDWDKWNSDRDHVITSAESWRHTNPYYTGSQDLDAYGNWQDVPDYGSVWFPAAGPGWAPYRDGRWVYEPFYGWTWVSYEPWGWAPYHYGRWFVYGGNWGWWPGPIYAGYYPMWAPAYVSFFGFGGGGWGVGIGFGFGGFGSIGWLPIGPGDRFYPWYGRGVARVNAANVYNIHSNYGGFAPLREGPRAFSNISGALNEERYRNAISSMPSNQFGRGRVPAQQQRFDAGSFRQASVMTGSLPVTPTRESFRPSDRQVSPGAIPSRAVTSQRFLSSPRQGATTQAGFNRGGNPGASVQTARPSVGNTQVQHGYTPPSSRQAPSAQSTRPDWRTFTVPSQGSRPNVGVRTLEEQGAPQSRVTGNNQPARPSSFQPAESSRQSQNYSRGSSRNSGYSRPALNLQQPIVTPRRSSNSSPSPRGGSRGGSSSSSGRASSGHNGR
jgi:hypothetical protein